MPWKKRTCYDDELDPKLVGLSEDKYADLYKCIGTPAYMRKVIESVWDKPDADGKMPVKPKPRKVKKKPV